MRQSEALAILNAGANVFLTVRPAQERRTC